MKVRGVSCQPATIAVSWAGTPRIASAKLRMKAEVTISMIMDDVRTVVTMTCLSMGRLSSRFRPARMKLATTPKAAASVGVATPR